ncbi:MAG: hypothetical protein ICV73_17830 [Acetobacteraceae bacterium]|nr:hypothetical protein [Acetobacteraceae bacterium]
MSRSIRVARTGTGAIAYLVPVAPERLPAVSPGDLLRAWNVARHGAVQRQWGTPRFLRFAQQGGREPTEIAIADPDAGAWTEAIDRVFGLETLMGLSLCLRLLALIEVLTRAARLEPFFDVTSDGVELHPSLLAAAAVLPLDSAARFDETALVKRLSFRMLPEGGAPSPARHP